MRTAPRKRCPKCHDPAALPRKRCPCGHRFAASVAELAAVGREALRRAIQAAQLDAAAWAHLEGEIENERARRRAADEFERLRAAALRLLDRGAA